MARLDHSLAEQTPDTLYASCQKLDGWRSSVNVGETERWISGGAGALCAVAGLSRRTPAVQC